MDREMSKNNDWVRKKRNKMKKIEQKEKNEKERETYIYIRILFTLSFLGSDS